MEVRVIDLRADAGAGLGLFEELHGMADPATFAQAPRGAVGRSYASPTRAFLRALVEDLPKARQMLADLRRDFTDAALQPGADGRVRAGAIATLLASEGFCGMAFDQAAVAEWIAREIPADRMEGLQIHMGVKGPLMMMEGMQGSVKTAHCSAADRAARAAGLIK